MDMPKREKFRVPLAIGVVLLTFAITTLAWWLWYQNEKEECRSLALQRRDDRAMWEFVLESVSLDEDFSRSFIHHMDERLPLQRCRGATLVTIPPGELDALVD